MFDQLWGSKSVKENRPLQDRLQKENLPVRRIETKSHFLLTLGSLNGSEDDGVRWSSSYEAVLRERGTHKNPLKKSTRRFRWSGDGSSGHPQRRSDEHRSDRNK